MCFSRALANLNVQVLLHASCTPLARLLHASIPLYMWFSRALANLNGQVLLHASCTPVTCLLHASYAPLYHYICVQPRVSARVLERTGAGVEISRCSRELEKSSCAPRARLLHAAYTFLTRFLHAFCRASYTPLVRARTRQLARQLATLKKTQTLRACRRLSHALVVYTCI